MLTVIRWLLGLAAIARGIETLTRVNGGHGAVVGGALFSFALMIIGAVVISPELARWAATPFHRFIDSIYLPGGTFAETPEPNYRLANRYYRDGEDDLAIAEYEKVIKYHPTETRAYIALIDLWANRKGQPAKAARLYRRALRKIRASEERTELKRAYKSDDPSAFVLPPPTVPPETLGGRVKFPDLR